MSSLDIETSRLAIDIHSQYARLKITNNLSRRMKINVVRPQMVVERRAASFRVERNGKSSLSLNNTVQLKKLVLHKNMQRTHTDGSGSTKNSSFLDESSYGFQIQQPEYSVELQSSQSQSPQQVIQLPSQGSQQIVWDPGYVKVDWQAGGIQVEWDENTKPDIQVSQYSVEIRVKGNNVVHIAVVEGKVPGMKGRKINKRV
jgi:hypothetical protein